MELLEDERDIVVNISGSSAEKLLKIKEIFLSEGNDNTVEEVINMVYDFYFQSKKSIDEILLGIEQISNKLINEIEKEPLNTPVEYEKDGKPCMNVRLKGLNESVRSLETYTKIVKSSRKYIEPVELAKLEQKEKEIKIKELECGFKLKELEIKAINAQAFIKAKS